MAMELSNRVEVDDKWVDMPAGFPTITLQGSKTVHTFRFPKFTTAAKYDPLISSSGLGGDDGAGAISSSPQSHKMSGALRSAAALVTLAMAGWQVA